MTNAEKWVPIHPGRETAGLKVQCVYLGCTQTPIVIERFKDHDALLCETHAAMRAYKPNQHEREPNAPEVLVIDSLSQRWEAILAKVEAARVRWEYRVIEAYLYLDTSQLDEQGAEGWELAAVLSGESPVRYVFKRRAAGAGEGGQA